MSDVLPTLESVFTNEYWGNPQPAPVQNTERDNLDIERSVLRQVRDWAGLAAIGIFTGDSRKPVADGTLLDSSGSNPDLQPGTILLADIEYIVPASHGKTEEQCRNYLTKQSKLVKAWDERRLPFYLRDVIRDEAELQSPASVLFRRNSRTHKAERGAQTVVYPYKRILCNPSRGQHYARGVHITGIAPNRLGEPILRTESMYSYSTPELDLYGDVIKSFFPHDFVISALAIGETYQLQKGHLLRLRSAELCVRGILEPVKAKTKQRHGLVFGRLATAQDYV